MPTPGPLFFCCQHIPYFWIRLRNFSQHGGGKYMTATPTYPKTSWKQCWTPVEMCLWSLSRVIWGTQGHFFQRANITCDVDEILWPGPDRRRDDADADYPVRVLPLETSIILRMDSSLHVLSAWHFKGQLFVQNSMCIVLLYPIMWAHKRIKQ